MAFLELVKNNLTTLPYFIGRPVAAVPYGYRPGIAGIYRRRKNEILASNDFSIEERKEFVFRKVKDLAVYANRHVPFYTDLFRNADVKPERLTCFSDLVNLPIITKDDLQSVPL